MEPSQYRTRESGRTQPSRKDGRERKKKGGWRTLRNTILWAVGSILGLIIVAIGVGTLTPWGNNMRMLLAETVASTRHYQLARYLTNAAEYNQIVNGINGSSVVNTGVSGSVHVVGGNFTNAGPVQLKHISGKGYSGFVMLVHDPQLVRLVKAKVTGAEGEYISNMIPRVGAEAGVNASGFEDPNGEGWGGIPVGLEYVDYQTINPLRTDNNWTDVGFTSSGVMVMGQYSMSQLRSYGVRDAMQFRPELVVNGRPMITSGDGGWGIDPRTAIGQRSDGTVIFIVIDGRFHNGSVGATQRQMMDFMLQYGAVNACAMDGGSSSVMYAGGKILNSPSTIDPHGERHLPDAWLVFPSVSSANAYTP